MAAGAGVVLSVILLGMASGVLLVLAYIWPALPEHMPWFNTAASVWAAGSAGCSALLTTGVIVKAARRTLRADD